MTTSRRLPARIVPLVLLLTTACTAPLASGPSALDSGSYPPALESNGELHLYLQPFPPEARRLSLRIAAIAVNRADGEPEPLLESPVDLLGAEMAGAQKRLAVRVLPPGLYRGLSIELAAASLAADGGPIELLVPTEPVVLSHGFSVSRRRASTLFLSLDPETMADVSYRLEPAFSLGEPTRHLTNLMGFATSPARNVVTVFNKHSVQVIDTIATKSGPRGAALDQRRGSVFVSAAGDDSIEVIDVSTRQILGNIRLTAGDEPHQIVLSSDGRTLVSANFGSNTASIIDTGAMREIMRVPLRSRPTDVVVDPSRPRAYVLQPQANSVSVMDFQARRLARTGVLEESPVQGALSEDGSTLYLITENSPNLLVVDAGSLALRARIYVGHGATSVKLDPRTGLVYVGRRSGDIAVVDPRALMFIDQLEVDGVPAFLAIDGEQSCLFVVVSDRGWIQKLDLVSSKVLGTLEVEPHSREIVIMGER